MRLLTNCFQFRRFSFITLPIKCSMIRMLQEVGFYSCFNGCRKRIPARQNSFLPSFFRKTRQVSAGLLRMLSENRFAGFSSTIWFRAWRGFVGFSAENSTGCGVFSHNHTDYGKNHPVGAAALSGPCSFCKRKFDFFDKLGPAGFCRAFALFSCQLVADVSHK